MPPSVPRPLSLATTLPLHIQSLGAVRVTLTGTPLHLPLSKSAEVLVWLALNGEATRDRIVDALWGGSDERRHVEYFKVAVRHLRLALAAHPAVTFNPLPFEAGVYRLSERFTLDLDAGLARRALVSLAPQDLRRAVEAYSGAFLPAVEAEWAEPVRADVLEATVAAATTLGSQLERTAPGEAVAWYERAIELDPLHEDGHVRLVRLHTSLGHEVAARHASGRYRRMLREEWGREPEEDPGRRFE
nr:BTAD domain-containing putative transcriptional regulator [Deinococcus aestuarii]